MSKRSLPKDILEEAMKLLDELSILKATAIWQHTKIEEFINRHTDEEVEVMGWEEKEKLYKVAEELQGRLNGSVRDLVRVSNKYEEMRIRVNKKYGTKLPGVKGDMDNLMRIWREEDDEE
jgi:ABC-type proline/glycine betaine transport system ATPase subunit